MGLNTNLNENSKLNFNGNNLNTYGTTNTSTNTYNPFNSGDQSNLLVDYHEFTQPKYDDRGFKLNDTPVEFRFDEDTQSVITDTVNLEFKTDTQYDVKQAKATVTGFDSVVSLSEKKDTISDPLLYSDGISYTDEVQIMIDSVQERLDELNKELAPLQEEYDTNIIIVKNPVLFNPNGINDKALEACKEAEEKMAPLKAEKAELEAMLYQLEQERKIAPYLDILRTEKYKEFESSYEGEYWYFMDSVDLEYIEELEKDIAELNHEVSSLADKRRRPQYRKEYEEKSKELAKLKEEYETISVMKYMTDDQRLAYIYYLENDPEKAKKMVEALEDQINRGKGTEQAMKFIDGLDHMTEEQLKDNLANMFDCSVKGLGDGVDTFFEGLENCIVNNDVLTADEYERMIILQYLKEHSNVLDECYEFNSSLGNMIPSMTASVIVSCFATPLAGEIVGSSLMGLSACGNAKHQALVGGHSLLASWIYGIFSGGSEAVLGFFLGKIPGISKESGFTLKELLSEGAEEFLQEWIDAGLQAVILGEDIDLTQISEQSVESFWMGVLMAGFLNGGKKVVDVTVNGKKYAIKIEETLAYAKAHPEMSISEVIAEVNKINKEIAKGNADVADINVDTVDGTNIAQAEAKLDSIMAKAHIEDGTGAVNFKNNLKKLLNSGDPTSVKLAENIINAMENMEVNFVTDADGISIENGVLTVSSNLFTSSEISMHELGHLAYALSIANTNLEINIDSAVESLNDSKKVSSLLNEAAQYLKSIKDEIRKANPGASDAQIEAMYKSRVAGDPKAMQYELLGSLIDDIYAGSNPYYEYMESSGLLGHDSDYYTPDSQASEIYADYLALKQSGMSIEELSSVFGSEFVESMEAIYAESALVMENNLDNFGSAEYKAPEPVIFDLAARQKELTQLKQELAKLEADPNAKERDKKKLRKKIDSLQSRIDAYNEFKNRANTTIVAILSGSRSDGKPIGQVILEFENNEALKRHLNNTNNGGGHNYNSPAVKNVIDAKSNKLSSIRAQLDSNGTVTLPSGVEVIQYTDANGKTHTVYIESIVDANHKKKSVFMYEDINEGTDEYLAYVNDLVGDNRLRIEPNSDGAYVTEIPDPNNPNISHRITFKINANGDPYIASVFPVVI